MLLPVDLRRFKGTLFICYIMITTSCIASDDNTGKGLLHSLLGGQVNIGMRNDYRLQDCYSSSFKQTFPGIDYAFYGYNIFYGFPLDRGVDPGFTYPIFETDYFDKLQTTDCKYSLPKGLIAVPSVSCDVFFTSDTIETTNELSRSLSVSTKISGAFEKFSFSASSSFQRSSSEISKGESVKILSSAKCKYYTSKLQKINAPAFSRSFIDWARVLNKTNDGKYYFEFFDTFGTHYPVSTVFGARLTYEHSMESSFFKKMKETKINVAAQASILSMFSAGVDITDHQRSEASELEKSVTTKLTSVGGTPPANGDAMSWASAVQEQPAPIEYSLDSIVNLFSERYMANLDINYKQIARKMQMFQHEYCRFLNKKGEVDTCKTLNPGIFIPNTFIYGKLYDGRRLGKSSIEECIELCQEESKCVAVGFCKGCKPGWGDYQKCSLYGTFGKVIDHKDWEVMIFPAKILDLTNKTGYENNQVLNNNFTIPDAKIIGTERIWWETENVTTTEECAQKCEDDTLCIAFSYCSCPEKISRCRIYAEDKIKEIKPEKGTTVGFIAR